MSVAAPGPDRLGLALVQNRRYILDHGYLSSLPRPRRLPARLSQPGGGDQRRAPAVTGALPAWLTGSLVRSRPRSSRSATGASATGSTGSRRSTASASPTERSPTRAASFRARPIATPSAASGSRAPSPRTCAGPSSSGCSRSSRPTSPTTRTSTSRASASAYIAMTETPLPIEFDRDTLATVGGLRFADRLNGQVTTAHPHHDRERDELCQLQRPPLAPWAHRLWGLPSGSRARRPIASLPVSEPAYMRAFGMSERYLILAEYPLRVNPLQLALSASRSSRTTAGPSSARACSSSNARPWRPAAGGVRDRRLLLLPPRQRVRARPPARAGPGRI